MGFSSKILAHSVNSYDKQIITMELTFPRIVLSEFNTHRMFSRNAASSRAIPISKFIERVEQDPFIPIHWGVNQKGMQAFSEMDSKTASECEKIWLAHRDTAVKTAKELSELGLHKQITNRILEPWMWVTVICTGNLEAWNNFWNLRCHQDAEPHINRIANLSRASYINSKPQFLKNGEWHLPLIGFSGDELLSLLERVKVSVGRCARVSYLTHDGIRDTDADIKLHDRLMESKHFSPFEHVAQADSSTLFSGNLGEGWIQYRKTLNGEFQNEFIIQ